MIEGGPVVDARLPRPPHRRFTWCVAALLLLSACMSTRRWDEQPSWEGKDLGRYPYHPLAYHLDLCVLAYQLHTQTLVWPFDPYYEAIDGRRDKYMDDVQVWARTQAVAQLGSDAPDAYRGPGMLGGFPDNPHHDPVLYRYRGLDPWSDAINKMSEEWLEMKTSKKITGRIGELYVCQRKAGAAETEVVLQRLERARDVRATDAPDVLLAFEGGTGDKGDPGEPASQSIMGFVLLRTLPNGRYDVHIAFRASRSGSGFRSFAEAHWDQDGPIGAAAAGNPDWITDLGYRRERYAYVSTVGEVHRGFAHSMRSTLPTLFRCLREVARIRGGAPPESIDVTGHSLGGALATHLASAVLLGDRYGPDGSGPAMPAELRDWPWNRIKLITYSAPRAGDKLWAKTLTETCLRSDFFSTAISPRDSHALTPTDPEIVARLNDPSRPAGFRVLDTRDPLTTEKIIGGKHVGKTVYVNKPSTSDFVTFAFERHDLVSVRDYIATAVDDRRTPPPSMAKPTAQELGLEVDEKQEGSVAELKKLAATIDRYYRERGIPFDHAAFEEALALRLAIEEGE